jgi:hypothetical protein
MRTARSRTSGEKRFVFLLMAPSSQSVEPPQNPGLFRMVAVSAKRTVSLVNIQSNPVSPQTEIEDVLNGKLFYQTLRVFIPENTALGFLEEYPEAPDELSCFALDLRGSERDAIDAFFNEGNNKLIFAEEYVASLTPESIVPEWITEIRNWLNPPAARTRRSSRASA